MRPRHMLILLNELMQARYSEFEGKPGKHTAVWNDEHL